jgi:hypothetical protein
MKHEDERSINGWTPTTRPWIVCAANRYGDTIITGARHHDNIMRAAVAAIGGSFDAQDHDAWKRGHSVLMSRVPEGGREEQGFIDQFGRFYDREEAMQLALQNDQVNNHKGERFLCSEHLY